MAVRESNVESHAFQDTEELAAMRAMPFMFHQACLLPLRANKNPERQAWSGATRGSRFTRLFRSPPPTV